MANSDVALPDATGAEPIYDRVGTVAGLVLTRWKRRSAVLRARLGWGDTTALHAFPVLRQLVSRALQTELRRPSVAALALPLHPTV